MSAREESKIGWCEIHRYSWRPGNRCPRCPVPSGEVETPCATCGGVKHEGGTFYPDTESFLKGLDCPDCGVETPEAAVKAAVEVMAQAAFDRGGNYGKTWDESGDKAQYRSAMRPLLDALMDAGWTPPGGPE